MEEDRIVIWRIMKDNNQRENYLFVLPEIKEPVYLRERCTYHCEHMNNSYIIEIFVGTYSKHISKRTTAKCEICIQKPLRRKTIANFNLSQLIPKRRAREKLHHSI